jgi:hypothetical protein
MLTKKGKAAAFVVAAVIAAAMAGGWHWHKPNTQSHPSAGWAWDDDTPAADSSVPSD